jgi:hypothetical protein
MRSAPADIWRRWPERGGAVGWSTQISEAPRESWVRFPTSPLDGTGVQTPHVAAFFNHLAKKG